MQIHKIYFFFSFFLIVVLFSCNNEDPKEFKKEIPLKETWKKGGEFNADSAFKYIKKQVDFGPRVPKTNNHKNCGNWLVNKLTNFKIPKQIFFLQEIPLGATGKIQRIGLARKLGIEK